MNKVLKRALIVSSSLLLCACQSKGPDTSITSDSSSSSTSSPSFSQPEGLYTKLTRAISRLGNFSAYGTMEYGAYDLQGGTTLEQSMNMVEIDLAEDAYYYSENDIASGEVMFEERFIKNDNGKFTQESLNYQTNMVDSITFTDDYDTVMQNPLLELQVADLGAISGQLQWYEIKDMTLAAEATYFLTGYDTVSEESLEVAQYAIHYDGDNIDQMRILLEYYDDYSEATYGEQYLFTLQLSDFGNAEIKEITPYVETSNHSYLQNSLNELTRAKNMTINVRTTTTDGKTEYADTDYLIDFENYIFVDPIIFTKNIYENGEVVSSHQCYSVYKQVGDNINLNDSLTSNDGTLTIFDIDAETNEVVASTDFNEYFGTSSNYTFVTLIPYFNYLDAACYKDVGNDSFKPYIATYDYATSAFIPYGATYAFSSVKNNMTIYMENQKLDRVELTYSETDSTSYETINKVDILSYNSLNTTVIPDYILNLGE